MGSNLSYFKPFTRLYFLLYTGLYLINQFIESKGVYNYYLSSYLDDLLVMPIILTITLVAMKIITRKPMFELDIVMLVMAFLLISLLFEIILPRYKVIYTQDYWDIVCYAFGTGMFYLFRRKCLVL